MLAAMKRLAPLVLAAALSTTAAGCYGSYSAFHAVHGWNGHASGSKVVNSLIHFGFYVIPVYPLCLFGDLIIFNNVEFITGKPVF
jgi:hypothetical protein